MTTLRRAFVASSIAWAALLPLAPFAASQPAPAHFWYGLAFIVYGAGSFICHQLPTRSFFLWSAQWPVCARCTGIYFGAAVAAIVAAVRLKPDATSGAEVRLMPDTTSGAEVRLKPDTTYETSATIAATSLTPRLILAVAAVPTVATLVYEWTTGDMPSHAIRALAGAPLGAAVAFVVVKALATTPRPSRPDPPTPVESGFSRT